MPPPPEHRPSAPSLAHSAGGHHEWKQTSLLYSVVDKEEAGQLSARISRGWGGGGGGGGGQFHTSSTPLPFH